MTNSHLNNIVNRFAEVVEDFRNRQIIRDEDLEHHSKSNIHSWLQFAMIEAGRKCGLLAVPEIKLRFETPIDPKKFGIKKKRKRHFLRADIAFYDDHKKLVGVSEIFTMDEAHGALPSNKLAEVGHYWLTPRDSLIHMISHAEEKPKFVILVAILLKRSPYVWWRIGIDDIDSQLRGSKNYYETFKPYWRAFRDEIAVENSLIIISKEDVERV